MQFNTYFAPTQADQNRVVAALRSSGFQVTRTFPNRTIVDAMGPASAAEALFATEIHRVLQPGRGERYINVRPAVIPPGLRDVMAGIVGLTNVRTLHADNIRARGVAPFTGKSTILGPDGGYGPAAFLGAYDLPGRHGYFGQGQAAGIVMDADYVDSDLASFLNYFTVARSTKVPTVRILIDGGPPSGITADSAETTLDIETIAGLAPDAGLYVYEFPSFEYDSISWTPTNRL
jgi:subtilase family serine protease